MALNFEDFKRGTLWRDGTDGQIYQVAETYEKLIDLERDGQSFGYKKFIRAVVITSRGKWNMGEIQTIRYERAKLVWSPINV